MLTNKEIEVLCYCRGCLNRKCGLDLERSDIKHLKMQKIAQSLCTVCLHSMI